MSIFLTPAQAREVYSSGVNAAEELEKYAKIAQAEREIAKLAYQAGVEDALSGLVMNNTFAPFTSEWCLYNKGYNLTSIRSE